MCFSKIKYSNRMRSIYRDPKVLISLLLYSEDVIAILLKNIFNNIGYFMSLPVVFNIKPFKFFDL